MTRPTVDDVPDAANVLDFSLVKENGTTSWSRAVQSAGAGTTIEQPKDDRPDLFIVELQDSEDGHNVSLAEERGSETFIGWCSCDGYKFDQGDGPCAHLCRVRQAHALDDVTVPYVDPVQDVDAEVREPDVDDQEDGAENVQELEPASGADDSDADPQGERPDHAGGPTPSPANAPRAPSAADPFADSLQDVDDRFIMTLGGDEYIKREGYARLAYVQGLEIDTELVTWASDTDFTAAEARAVVRDPETDRTWSGHATAHLEDEDLSGAAGNLNELAETRAITRALAWATGEGMSAAEHPDGAEDATVATDGGQDHV